MTQVRQSDGTFSDLRPRRSEIASAKDHGNVVPFLDKQATAMLSAMGKQLKAVRAESRAALAALEQKLIAETTQARDALETQFQARMTELEQSFDGRVTGALVAAYSEAVHKLAQKFADRLSPQHGERAADLTLECAGMGVEYLALSAYSESSAPIVLADPFKGDRFTVQPIDIPAVASDLLSRAANAALKRVRAVKAAGDDCNVALGRFRDRVRPLLQNVGLHAISENDMAVLLAKRDGLIASYQRSIDLCKEAGAAHQELGHLLGGAIALGPIAKVHESEVILAPHDAAVFVTRFLAPARNQ